MPKKVMRADQLLKGDEQVNVSPKTTKKNCDGGAASQDEDLSQSSRSWTQLSLEIDQVQVNVSVGVARREELAAMAAAQHTKALAGFLAGTKVVSQQNGQRNGN